MFDARVAYGQVASMAPAPHTFLWQCRRGVLQATSQLGPTQLRVYVYFWRRSSQRCRVHSTQVRNDIAWPTWSNSRVKLATAGFVCEGVALQFVRPQYSVIVLPFWACPRRSLICMLK